MFSRMFVDLTNESRGDVVATLHKELMVLAKKRLPLIEAKAVTQSAEINEIWEMRHRSYLRLAFLALVVSLALTFVLFYASYRTDSFMRATQSWHSVDGTVIETEVVEKRLNDEINYSPRIVYRFSVDGKIYKNDRVGLFEPIYSFKIDAENALKSYPVGQTITVYYDPEQPGESLLDRSNTNIWRIFLYLVLLSDIIALIVFARFAVKHKSVTGYNLTIFDLLHNLRSQNNH